MLYTCCRAVGHGVTVHIKIESFYNKKTTCCIKHIRSVCVVHLQTEVLFKGIVHTSIELLCMSAMEK